MNRTRTASAVAALLLALCRPVASAADVIERTFDVEPGGRFVLDTDRGSVEVKTTEEARVGVRVERRVRSGSARETDHEVRFDQRGSEVSVRGETDRGLLGLRSSRLEVRYTVTVPRRFDLRLDTAGGDITVTDLEGDLAAHTSGGDMALGRIFGAVDASTSGGDVELSGSTVEATLRSSGGDLRIGDVDGRVDALTSGGDVRIDRAGGDVTASTSGGNITVGEVRGAIDARTSGGDVIATLTTQPESDCRLSTSGGSVEVRLAAGIGAEVDAYTSGGELELDVPVTVRGKLSKSRVEGRVNGGGPLLTLRSSGGDIVVRGLD
ncbi:MAG: DUF4097 family beta strand repeat-containing protein [Thermoanaerobaculia bacterium]